MKKRIGIGIVMVVGLVAVACGGSGVPDNALGHYVVAIDQVEDDWTDGVEDAFNGKEYLGTGEEPPSNLSVDDVLQDAEENIDDLIRVTQKAVAALNALSASVPDEALAFHRRFLDTLNDGLGIWTDGLQPLKRGDFGSFIEGYPDIQRRAVAFNRQLDSLGPERNALAQMALDID